MYEKLKEEFKKKHPHENFEKWGQVIEDITSNCLEYADQIKCDFSIKVTEEKKDIQESMFEIIISDGKIIIKLIFEDGVKNGTFLSSFAIPNTARMLKDS